MEKYFERGTLDEDEMRWGLKLGMIHHDVFPVFVVSARKNMGSGRIMGFIDNVAPSPLEAQPEQTAEGGEVAFDATKPTVLFVFKTHLEPNLGKLTYFKVISGMVTPTSELINSQTGVTEKFHQLFIMDGKIRNPVERLVAGDIGATLKLKDTYTNQTLHSKGYNITITPIQFPEPRTRTAVVALSKQDNEKIGEVLQKIHMEDPTLLVEFSTELKQLILSGQGEQHLAVCRWHLEKVYGLKIDFVTPRISYRETIRRPAMASYRHKKQSGGAGQFGEVFMKIEPYYEGMAEPTEFTVRGKEEVDLPWGGKLLFYTQCRLLKLLLALSYGEGWVRRFRKSLSKRHSINNIIPLRSIYNQNFKSNTVPRLASFLHLLPHFFLKRHILPVLIFVKYSF
jgi:elongation factor G